MGRLIFLAAMAVIGCKLITGRWPWEMMAMPARPSSGHAPGSARACALLGVGPGAGRDAIIDAHKALLTRVHPDRGGSAALVHEANDARDLLLAEISGQRLR